MEEKRFHIIRKSNFDHEDWRGDEYFVAKDLIDYFAKRVSELLNEAEGPNSNDYFKVVPDDYVLPPKWEP